MVETSNNLTPKEQYDLKKQGKEGKSKIVPSKRVVKRVILWSAAALMLAGAVFGLIKLGTSVPSGQTALLLDAVSASDWTTGNKEAKVILVEYSDFQCPACGAFYPLVKQITEKYGAQMQFVYRHFPLPQHANAKPASYATEAAGKQGKFWEMHDMIFEHQRDWSEESNAADIFSGYAKSLGLDMAKYQKDVNSQETKDRVEKDYASGVKSAVDATPTFFLGGKKMQFQNYGDFENAVGGAIKSGNS